ncbi:uncharacterized protein LOC101852593 [Aplysia californica]|uniref:Uncharacterized protein LOC101852593 n=1 Tax=Aplysia californica TaxID=6500 RepID=A0ABM0JDY3_APLCA|nr:uncharacterized protein LOC101852593 [Aplysia californica]
MLLTNEAGLIPLEVKSTIATAVAYERARRVPEDNPIRASAEGTSKIRLKSINSWREVGRQSSNNAGLEHLIREPLRPVSTTPPWKTPCNLTINSKLAVSTTKTDPPNMRREAALETVHQLPTSDLDIFTDGHATDGYRLCGGGYWCLDKSSGEETCVSVPGDYTEAATVLKLPPCSAYCNGSKNNHVFKESTSSQTPSQSGVQHLMSRVTAVCTEIEDKMWTTICQCCEIHGHLHIQWIPGHCDIYGNDRADALANKGGHLDQSYTPVDIASANSCISRYIIAQAWEKARVHDSVGGKVKPPLERDKEKDLTVRQRRVLSQLRCNANSPIPQTYLHAIGSAPNDSCLACTSPDDLQHALYECPRGEAHRGPLMENNARPGLDVLWTRPQEVAAYQSACGRLPPS